MDKAIPTTLSRRTILRGLLGTGAVAGLAACGNSSSTSSSSSSTAAGASASATATASAAASASSDASAFPTLASLTPLASKFTQATYTDSTTGKSLPYNVFLPEGYSTSKKYPLVLYIADARFPGKAVTAPLSQYGALIWASAADQAKHPSIVIVPEYPEVILDDNSGSHTTTPYLELTGRFVTWLKTKYSVDTKKVYGTGQSMGCMTCLYLAGKYTDMFAAELFVSGQWDVSVLTKLTKAKFFYIAAGGDSKSTGGQSDVENLLKTNNVPFQTATWDATWSAAQFAAATKKIFAAGDKNNFATFKSGTVLTANPTSGGMEHLASFEPAYKITGLRDWLFEQSA